MTKRTRPHGVPHTPAPKPAMQFDAARQFRLCALLADAMKAGTALGNAFATLAPDCSRSNIAVAKVFATRLVETLDALDALVAGGGVITNAKAAIDALNSALPKPPAELHVVGTGGDAA